MEKENSRPRSSRSTGKGTWQPHGMSLQEVQFCKKIKFGEGHEAGRWEGVEENVDFVRSLQRASSPCNAMVGSLAECK